MQPIEFDIESARAAKKVMYDAYWEIIQDLQNLIAEAWQLEDQWIAPSADQFQLEFELYKNNFRKAVDPLWLLINQLEREIAKWEEAAAHLE